MQGIKERIKNKVHNLNPDKEMSLIHHRLMKEYGWIPLSELKKTPMETLFNLLGHIVKEHKDEEKRMKKSNRGKR